MTDFSSRSSSRGVLTKFALLLTVTTTAFGISGCATSNNPQKAMMKQMAYHQELAQQRAEADMAFEKELALKVPEMKAEGYEQAGDNYIRQGNMDMAFLQYEKALSLDSESSSARYKMGRLLLNRGLNSEAMKTFEEMKKRDSKNPLAYEGIARVHIALKNYEKAGNNLEKALQLKPDFWQCHGLFAFMYDRQNRYNDAIESYQKAIAVKPDSFLLYNNLGMSYYMMGEYGKSVEAYTKALKINDKASATYNNLGMALGKLGRYDDAMNAFKRAGDEASAYNNLGIIYMADKQYEKALTAFEKAIELKPAFYVKASENMTKAKAALKNASATP